MPLRRRVTLALTLLGLLLSLLFATVTLAVAEDYEHVIATEILRGQAEDLGLRLSTGLPAHLPKSHRLSGYRQHDVPAQYARLRPGIHEDDASEGVHIGVFDSSAGRLYFVIDLSDIEAMEVHLNRVLAAIVVAGTLLAGLLGWCFAGAALKPLTRLAQAVDALPVAPQATALGAQVSNDELGHLAGAIDGYQRRLVDADAHERAFFADASHELRTPIAVVQGVAEVMLDDAEAERDPRRLERLRRLDRGVREMTDLMEMLLVIARRRAPQPELVNAAAFLRDTIEPLAGTGGGAIDLVAAGELYLPPREARLLVRHVLGKLGWPSSGAALLVHLDGHTLEITSLVRNDASIAPTRSDTGGGGALAQRMALQLGWQITELGAARWQLELPASALEHPLNDRLQP